MFSSLLVLFEEYPTILTVLSGLMFLGGIMFVLIMVYNINAFVKYLRRDKSEETTHTKQHSGLFWAVDGIVTFLFSMDFLTLFLIFI